MAIIETCEGAKATFILPQSYMTQNQGFCKFDRSKSFLSILQGVGTGGGGSGGGWVRTYYM